MIQKNDWIDAEKVENNPDIEMSWAIKASVHAETYMKLLHCTSAQSLRLTPYLIIFIYRIDSEIYEDFMNSFPEINLSQLDEDEMKSDAGKEKWRNWINKYEKKINDYNFGTLLRIDPTLDYTEENSIFVTRTQFYAIEIARNRQGLNNHFYQQQ